MKYTTWEELYNDNKELIEFEFKYRFCDCLNKILSKINVFQQEEHMEIDAGEPGFINEPHRKNIMKLEEVYKPLYNYIQTIFTEKPINNIGHETMLHLLKDEFIKIVLPTQDEIMKNRGKSDWRNECYKNECKSRKLANLLEGFVYYAYTLGNTNLDCEPENHYDNDPCIGSIDDSTKFKDYRRQRCCYLTSYGKDTSMAAMVSSLYDMGYKEAIKNGETDIKAVDNGIKVASEFIQDIFKKDN